MQITREDIKPKHLLTLTPTGAESVFERYGEQHLARRKSAILTAQIALPLQLSAVCHSVQIQHCTSGCGSEMFWNLSIIVFTHIDSERAV